MVFGHEPPADRKAFLGIRQGIHAADTVIAGHRKKDQRPWFGLKTVGHLKVQFPVFSLSGVVDDEFSSPIVIPSVVKVRDQRDATKGRKRLRAPVAAFGMVLVGLPFNGIIFAGIIMGREAIANTIRVVTKGHMALFNVGEGFNKVGDTGEGDPVAKDRRFLRANFGFEPIPAIREYPLHFGHFGETLPR